MDISEQPPAMVHQISDSFNQVSFKTHRTVRRLLTDPPKLSTRKIRQICSKPGRPIKQIHQLRAERLVPGISQTVFQTASQTAIENVCPEFFRDGGT